MTTVNKQVSEGGDDCYEVDNNSVWYNSDLLAFGHITFDYDAGYRWQNVDIPKAAKIDLATLSVYLTAEGGTLDATAKAVDEDNPLNWISGSRPSQRPKTGSVSAGKAEWGNWGINNWITLNVTTLIQAIVSRSGWMPNNALALVIEDDAVALNYIQHRAYEFAGNAHGAKLDITYSTPKLKTGISDSNEHGVGITDATEFTIEVT